MIKQRLAFVTNGIALRMLESGSGTAGKSTAFDEITVSDPNLAIATDFYAAHHCR